MSELFHGGEVKHVLHFCCPFPDPCFLPLKAVWQSCRDLFWGTETLSKPVYYYKKKIRFWIITDCGLKRMWLISKCLATGGLTLGCSSILCCKLFGVCRLWLHRETEGLIGAARSRIQAFFYNEQSRMKNSQDFVFVFQVGCKKRSWSPESKQPELQWDWAASPGGRTAEGAAGSGVQETSRGVHVSALFGMSTLHT